MIGPPTQPEVERARRDVAFAIFVMLLGTYAYFWQSRDWNSASRLALAYSLAERGQLEIDGLEEQCGHREANPLSPRFGEIVDGDMAHVGGHFYTEKAPGSSLLGAVVHVAARAIFRLPPHPLGTSALARWPADYLITLATSGAMTAAIAVVLYAFSLRLGVGHAAGAVLALAYGLGTPALVYATLLHGNQATAFCTVTSFFLLYRATNEGRATLISMTLAGLLGGFAIVIEYQAIGIVALTGVYAVAAIRRPGPLAAYIAAGITAGSILLVYNQLAFGGPFELSYRHLVSPEFGPMHSQKNPLGLRLANWNHAQLVISSVMWGGYRGLLFYAPVMFAAPLGLIGLARRRAWGVACVSLGAIAWMLLINVSYPAWQGGWCTGPRFLVPAIPFGMLLVAGLLGLDRAGALATIVSLLAAAGAVLMLACVAVGGRFPTEFKNPVFEIVLPRWSANAAALAKLPPVVAGERQFEWNVGRWLVDHAAPAGWIPPEPSVWQAAQFGPLVVFWLAMIGVLGWRLARPVAK